MRKSYERGTKIASILVLSLGATACGGSGSNKPEKHGRPKEAVSSGITVRPEYFSNGTRELLISGGDATEGANIFEFCDGHDLVEETLTNSGAGNETAVSALSRSVDYPGCADGRLTPSDFQLNSDAVK